MENEKDATPEATQGVDTPDVKTDAVKQIQPLNEREIAILASINQNAVQLKAKLFDNDQQRRQLEQELDQAQRHFNGAVASLGASHAIENPTLTPDFRVLVRGGQKI